MVKGLYNKSNRWQGPRITAPLPPPDNMPWGPSPQQNPAYIDPRVSPNNAGFPLPRGPSLPQGGQGPPQAPMTPMQEPPILGPQQPTMQTSSMSRRATIGRPRKPPGSQQPSSAATTAEPAGSQLLRMMHGGGRMR
jgi:hypothetical protein